jgi:hypothetical protein
MLMRISLCVICGNEAAIIERFLESFAPAFDELSMTRAIGTAEADKTADLASAWCYENGKAFVFSEYVNAPDSNLAHIDNFAAARNQSFAQGTGDWLLWADCDDMLSDADKLRELLSADGIGALVRFPYDVVGTNKQPMRERAIRRPAFHAGNHWIFAVHENLRVAPGTAISDSQIPVWIHQPKIVGPENRKRNKAILSRVLQNSSANYFYLHQEWFCEGNKLNAEKFGRLALGFPDLEPSFRYEVNLNLCRLANDTDDALRYAMAAQAVFPWCREALALTALTMIDRHDYDRALFFAKRMDEQTPLPTSDRLPWTHEPKWYGWASVDLLSRCLRLCGQYEEAATAQRRGGPAVISLIHATRGRPAQATQARNNWLNLAADAAHVQHLFCVDADDAASVRMARQYEHVVSDGQSCVAAWNLGAAFASGDLLVQLSDDWIPVPGWDAKLLAAISRAGKTLSDQLVVAVGDGTRTDDLLCMAICTRARMAEQDGGDLFSPEYESVFSDNEFSHRAWRDGVVIDARKEIVFEHQHPAFGKAAMDETYAHNNKRERYKRGEATFRQSNPDAFTQ